ncbi:hypothetical protein ACFFF7_11970 [Novosphingobium aquiterrae]|uniref:Uncharacterized protein n=1 Tax=Novosphingobium aquiterrae TaxID=624388 RepID=A0ABV6PJX2_9SPHN
MTAWSSIERPLLRKPWQWYIAAALAFDTLLTSGCRSWSDPAPRGALMLYDYPAVPAIYHGEWVGRLQDCGVTGDRGIHLAVTAQTVELQPVIAVEGYSDFEAVFVTVRRDDGTDQRLNLDISTDHRGIRVSTGNGSRETVLRHCPTNAP